MKTRKIRRSRINENQKITLTLGQLKRLVKEGMNGQFIWRIEEIDTNGESIGCIEDSLRSDDSSEPYFTSPEEAFEDGLNVLKQYDGDYMLTVSINIADKRYEALAKKLKAVLRNGEIIEESHILMRNIKKARSNESRKAIHTHRRLKRLVRENRKPRMIIKESSSRIDQHINPNERGFIFSDVDENESVIIIFASSVDKLVEELAQDEEYLEDSNIEEVFDSEVGEIFNSASSFESQPWVRGKGHSGWNIMRII